MTAAAKRGSARSRDRKRSRIVRWQGILIFLVLVALAAGFWLLFLDRLAERRIEKTGTAVVGAKVELDKADVSFSPLGLTLLGLQVANPDAPMTNAVEVGRIAFHMDGPSALRRKIIIEEMSVENVRLNTPRKTSGAVARAEGKAPLEQLLELPSFVIPNVQEVLEEEKDALRSVQALTAGAAGAQAIQTRWDARIKEIRAAADVEDYKKRLADLKAKTGKISIGGVLGGTKEVLALQKQIRADIQTVSEAKQAFTTDLSTLKKTVADAPAVVGDDVRRLVDKYSLGPAGLANFSRLRFGERIASSIRSALRWNERLSPFLERVKEKIKGQEVVKPLRAKGRDVRFQEDRPLPDFLARLAKVSVSLPQGDFAGRIENLTSEQDVLGQPLRFAFSAGNLKGLRSLALEGTFDRVDPARREDVVSLKLRGFAAKDVKLVTSPALPVSLSEGLVDLDIGATLAKGVLEGGLTAAVRSARIAVGPAEARPGLAGRVGTAIRSALAGISGLTVTAKISGTPDDFKLDIRSDLDDVLKSAVGNLVRDQMAGFESELREAIKGRIEGPLETLGSSVKALDGLGLELDGLEKRLADLLKK